MAGFPEILVLLGLLAASLASLGLVMYIMYRLGLYIAFNFIVHKPEDLAEDSE